MRVAVPLFGKRVSPHFRTSAEVLLVDVIRGKIIDEKRIYWKELGAFERIEKLRQWNVEVLLCGGITLFNKGRVRALGVEVVSELRGKAKDVLKQWLQGHSSIGQ